MVGETRVHTVIPIFYRKVETPPGSSQGIHILYTRDMDQETLIVAIFFTFMVGAGIGFYVTKFVVGL